MNYAPYMGFACNIYQNGAIEHVPSLPGKYFVTSQSSITNEDQFDVYILNKYIVSSKKEGEKFTLIIHMGSDEYHYVWSK